MSAESAEFQRQQQAINDEIAQAQATNRQALLLAESNVESLKIESVLVLFFKPQSFLTTDGSSL